MSVMDDDLDKIAEGKTSVKTALAVFAVILKRTNSDVTDIKKLLENEYTTKQYVLALTNALEARVKMLERIVYGAVGVILLTFIGALLTLVMRK